MALIDISIVNAALPRIGASFGVDLGAMSWVSSGYLIASVVVMPLTGWCRRRFGYRRYFIASVALFTLGSALCGASWSFDTLIIARILQGLGGGTVIPLAQA